MKKTIAQISKETLKLVDYFGRCKPGQQMTYESIENATGVTMDERGKSFMRTALHKLKIEYSVIIGKGIKLADPGTTMPIVVHKLGRIDKAVKRAERSQKNLQQKFFDSLDVPEQRQLLYLGAVFGAIRVASNNGKLVYANKKMSNVSNIQIPIPTY